DDAIYHGVNSKIRKNKDGRPRKRSQHTKGNKLWEFIRDALKDPTTCPSVVRWEDPVQGVFRIVESEKLARLWGDRKNNQKMTYEKLSRAMRTYYEKQILVPVPKTGLYPKKLVYKFGPGAHGWSAPPDLVAAAVAANLMEEHHHF
ncbi:Protein TAG-97 b, partial [Aphelenchoides avenae]